MKQNTTSKLLFRLLPIQILLAEIGSINGIAEIVGISIGIRQRSHMMGLKNEIREKSVN